MKTITSCILFCFLALIIVSTGCDNKKEKQQQMQARQDSLEQVRQRRQRLQQQRMDSLAAARADSIAAANSEAVFNPNEAGMSTEGRYSVQVGAWRSKDKGQKLAEKWQPRGFENAFVVKYGNEETGNIWFRVRLGKFFTKKEAKNLQTWLQENYQSKSWISYVE